MSFYNKLFDMNKDYAPLLGMLGVNKDFFSRFRDIELTTNGTVIRVFTRLGGGNIKGYQETWNKIKKHELYIKDYDDEFDNTYAYIEFDIPDKFKQTAKKMFKGEPISFKEKFEKELEDMQKPGTESYNRAKEIADKLIEAMNSDDGSNGNIHIIKI